MLAGRMLDRRRALASVLGALCLAGCARTEPPERIVLVVIDTLRRDALGCYGGSTPTPELDALARRGVAVQGFRSAYYQTSSSMGALFTGRIPSLETGDPVRPLHWTGETWCGMARFGAPGALCLPESLPTLAEQLHAAGYWTIGVLSNDLLYEPSGFGRGFDDLVQVGGQPSPKPPWQERSWKRVHPAATAAIDRRLHDHFFLYVHYMDVHDYEPRGDQYADGVRAADAAVGALLAHLGERNLLDGALVIVTSDHGEHLGERHPPDPARALRSHFGNPSYEELLNVPLLVWPADAVKDGVPRGTTALHDWLLHRAGVAAAAPDLALADGEHYVSELMYRTYRVGRWKSSFARADGRPLLFDLESDPHEQRDLSGERADVLDAHRRRVDALTQALAARGPRRDALSAEERRRLEALGYLHPDGAQ
jgi:arylsulfatase A-like enzyme